MNQKRPTTTTQPSAAGVSPLDVSIVIVNWNTREMLRDCLTSVRAGLRGITALRDPELQQH